MAEQIAAGTRKKSRFNLPLWQRNVRYGEVDLAFFLIVIALLVIGIIMMFSASYAWAIAEGEDGTFYAANQIKNAIVGLVIMCVLCTVDYHIFQKPMIAVGAYIIPLVLLVMVFVPGIGVTEGGATRWIAIGGFNFQPSELMKIGIVVFLSYVIEKNYDNMRSFRKGMLPLLLFMAIPAALLIKEPHLSATVLIVLMCIILIFVGGADLKQFLMIGIAAVGAALLIGFLMSDSYEYIGKRINSWLDPFADSLGDTWQTCQSLIAIGSGGLFGLGLGESRQKYLYLPETKNDFVFSIVCEELGFVGAVTVLLLFAMLVIRGFHIAMHARDKFGMLVAIGLTSHIGLQAFFNIAVVSNLIPNTGISLPFFSYGGTALILQLAEMGIVLNISRVRYRVEKQKPADTGVMERTQPRQGGNL
ncbi:putative lipid II flippase FtsW [uncultured Ruminococcus sp.]|uniref:putative lipid II flippase FtsW n=1 Tax=uncultured Ruminococcus sp. TaxID=165186 RepID=UPI002602D7ED|nr:putative lipid II flippase FtsW [uncultured Ruminococcus sp.]